MRRRLVGPGLAALVFALTFGGLAGCKKTREDTSVLVIVNFDPDTYDLNQLRLAGYRVTDSSIAFGEGLLPTNPRPLTSGRETALVLLNDELAGEAITVRVWGLSDGQDVAFGRGDVIVELGVMQTVEITLGDAPDCGDGEVHPSEETCDTGIAVGMTGACPETVADCDDDDDCTADRVEGAGTCLALCFNERITECSFGDGCCPTGCGPTNDNDCDAQCGDGLIGTGETCDTLIPPGDPGSCPTSCDPDGNPCTDDALTGAGSCQAACPYALITEFFGGDGCCPPGGDATLDGDCQPVCGNGVLEPTETCDITIAAGQPGACPTDCTDPDPCTTGVLFDGGTCAASCAWTVTTNLIDGDGCCPPGGNANNDTDCPVVCGNGVVESGETCDTAIAAGQNGACPTCDDSLPCTNDTVLNAGTCTDSCSHTDITGCTGGDGCCPAGCGPSSDSDCTATCGDGIFEPAFGELCDTGIASGNPGACPTLADCDDTDDCTDDDVIGVGSCQAQCSNLPVACDDTGIDGCCSTGCNATTDDDCNAVCGNGVVEPSGGELCDTGIAPGNPGACPTSCSDGLPCTADTLTGAGTCAAQCTYPPITTFVDGDGCCPAGGNNNADDDCPVVCGNGAVETGELCDTTIPAGDAGACPTTADCDDGVDCTTDTLINAGSCTADCLNPTITTCLDGDGCCPTGCDLSNDDDCSDICGDSVVSGSETCDVSIAAGQPGACPTLADCDDTDPCTQNLLLGAGTCQAACDNPEVACANGDGCCPTGCTNNTDDDCPADCGNGIVESRGGEECDTGIPAGSPGACPTDCDDSDPCTTDTLNAAGTCQAWCDHQAITQCSLTSDGCCPGVCQPVDDADCGGCGNGVVDAANGEECDDGNTDNHDPCSNSCTVNNGREGDTCLNNGSCSNQFDCLDEPTYGLTDGYCVSTAVCDPAFPNLGCGPKGTCVASLGGYPNPVCAQRCADLTDCRWADGYTCQLIGAGVSACLP